MIGVHDMEPRPTARAERRLVWLIALFLVAFGIWAWRFELVEVSSGPGKVVPSSREQVIQSLEGGLLATLEVREGDVVQEGQLLAQLDPTRSASNVDEAAARYHAALATSVRLRAELQEQETLTFPDKLQGEEFSELRATERALFDSRRASLLETLAGLEDGLSLLEQEIGITTNLQAAGAASRVELIRLNREAVTTRLEIARLEAEFRVQASEELQKVNAEAEVQASIMRGRTDQLDRLTFHAPTRGIVKEVSVTTVGGVIQPGGQLMTIVPIDDQLLIEARISPRDIAFIHPGQSAMVKISAYDYAIFGGLTGEVVTISPDSVRDEVRNDQFYYRVFIRTQTDYLTNAAGATFPIVPGMVATVEIQTGSKTVWQYLIKPLNRAREALRER